MRISEDKDTPSASDRQLCQAWLSTNLYTHEKSTEKRELLAREWKRHFRSSESWEQFVPLGVERPPPTQATDLFLRGGLLSEWSQVSPCRLPWFCLHNAEWGASGLTKPRGLHCVSQH